MPKYVIEREIPGVGSFDGRQLREAAQTSCAVLRELGPEIQWVHSYVTADKTFCIYIAPDEGAIREHARRSGFPANRITEVVGMIDPTTADAPAAAWL